MDNERVKHHVFCKHVTENKIKTIINSSFHMKLLNDVATKHYMRATQVYHNTPCRAPGLFLCSLTDPIGAAKRSRHAHDTWKSLGVKVN